jgi:hypothetical protein
MDYCSCLGSYKRACSLDTRKSKEICISSFGGASKGTPLTTLRSGNFWLLFILPSQFYWTYAACVSTNVNMIIVQFFIFCHWCSITHRIDYILGPSVFYGPSAWSFLKRIFVVFIQMCLSSSLELIFRLAYNLIFLQIVLPVYLTFYVVCFSL